MKTSFIAESESSTPEEHKAYIDAIKQNVGYKPEPEVGIFWFNTEENDLFGVAKNPISKAKSTTAGIKVGRVPHEDNWIKLRKSAIIRGKSDGIFFQEYTTVPRGIVCLLEDGPFQINVGNWIKSVDKNLLMALITNEFNLENEKVKLQEDNHWDI